MNLPEQGPSPHTNQKPSYVLKPKHANSVSTNNGNSNEQREYNIALSRIETFLRRMKKRLDEFKPARPSYSVPGILSLRDFRVVLHELNTNEDGFQILTRDQINMVFKLAPRREGNVVDEKALQVAMAKAYSELGVQKLGRKENPLDDSPMSSPREKVGANKRNSTYQYAGERDCDPVMPAAPAAISSTASITSTTSVKSAKKQSGALETTGTLDQLQKTKLGKELVGQISWLNSFDSRFDECQKKLEFVRDSSVGSGITHITQLSKTLVPEA